MAEYKTNSVFIELGGNAVLYSINYEKIWSNRKNIDFTGRMGIEFPFGNIYTVSAPITAGVLLGKGRHKLELAGGILAILNFDNEGREKWKKEREQGIPPSTPYPEAITYFYSANIGYRMISKTGKIFYRFSYSPVIYSNTKYYHWGGISIGYIF